MFYVACDISVQLPDPLDFKCYDNSDLAAK